eukprot:TRINITY_DN23112_c0_g1_i1.p1 TRINITY_DN23112_c0_g1~~TRINITY_DN23112_c0_g1_i1.p1  ORF type:complete len:418 (-),score=95.42 TRINITY_DN23112_c0_g1_i1:436-1689(-)
MATQRFTLMISLTAVVSFAVLAFGAAPPPVCVCSGTQRCSNSLELNFTRQCTGASFQECIGIFNATDDDFVTMECNSGDLCCWGGMVSMQCDGGFHDIGPFDMCCKGNGTCWAYERWPSATCVQGRSSLCDNARENYSGCATGVGTCTGADVVLCDGVSSCTNVASAPALLASIANGQTPPNVGTSVVFGVPTITSININQIGLLTTTGVPACDAAVSNQTWLVTLRVLALSASAPPLPVVLQMFEQATVYTAVGPTVQFLNASDATSIRSSVVVDCDAPHVGPSTPFTISLVNVNATLQLGFNMGTTVVAYVKFKLNNGSFANPLLLNSTTTAARAGAAGTTGLASTTSTSTSASAGGGTTAAIVSFSTTGASVRHTTTSGSTDNLPSSVATTTRPVAVLAVFVLLLFAGVTGRFR